MRLSDVFRFYSNAYGSSLDTKASAAAPAAAQRSFLLAVPSAANEVPAPEHARVAFRGCPALRPGQHCGKRSCSGLAARPPPVSGAQSLPLR